MANIITCTAAKDPIVHFILVNHLIPLLCLLLGKKHVTPIIYKKVDRTLVSNYQPIINLTSLIVKIIESLIRDRIQLVICLHLISMALQLEILCYSTAYYNGMVGKYLEDNCAVDIICFDLGKVFDLVPHTCLLTKLESYGLTGNLLGWLKSFLVVRRQKVVINGHSSTWCKVGTGILLVSVLGPYCSIFT